MIYLIAIGVIVLLAFAIVALVYRGKAAAEQHQAEMQRRRAETAEDAVNQRQQLDQALAATQQAHREETIHATTPEHLALRTDFNNDWADASGLPGQSSTAHPLSDAAATGSTGAAGDTVNRAELSE